jgi:Flp pilus assembly pilin Flp
MGRMSLHLGDSESGVTAIEYGLIAVAAIAAISLFGTSLGTTFNTVATSM